ncbi:hypothetical protein OROMI_020295 [Orobanche minor]
MAKTSLITLLIFSCLLSIALCRNIAGDDSQAVEKSNPSVTGGKQEDWFLGIHPRPWPFVHPPIPAAGGFTWPPNRPWPHWEYASPPRPAGGFKWPPTDWPHWHFVNPPMPATGGFTWPPNRPWPHWQFVQPPIAAGSHWPPKDWPHWQFVHPPMPSKPSTGGEKTTDAAPAA